MKAASWLLFVCLFFWKPAYANAAANGNELLQKCGPIEKLDNDPGSLSSNEASGVVYCMGYIDSFMETFSFQFQAQLVPGVPYCLPEADVPKKEIVKVVVAYLKNHPEELGKPAGYHIFMALREAYPCNSEKDKEKAMKNKISDGQ